MQLRANIWVGFQDCSSMRRNERGYSGIFWASDSKVQIFLSKKQNNTSCCTVVLFKVDGLVCVGLDGCPSEGKYRALCGAYNK